MAISPIMTVCKSQLIAFSRGCPQSIFLLIISRHLSIYSGNSLIVFLVKALKGGIYLSQGLARLIKNTGKPLIKLGHFLLLVLVLPSYKFYLVAKKVLTKFYAPHKIRHRLIFSLAIDKI